MKFYCDISRGSGNSVKKVKCEGQAAGQDARAFRQRFGMAEESPSLWPLAVLEGGLQTQLACGTAAAALGCRENCSGK